MKARIARSIIVISTAIALAASLASLAQIHTLGQRMDAMSTKLAAIDHDLSATNQRLAYSGSHSGDRGAKFPNDFGKIAGQKWAE